MAVLKDCERSLAYTVRSVSVKGQKDQTSVRILYWETETEETDIQ